MMFRSKNRPNQLVFPACKKCNLGTSHADLVASMVGRLSIPEHPQDVREFGWLMDSIRNNIPDLLLEMRLSRSAEKFAFRDHGIDPKAGVGFLRANGPLLTKYMRTFVVKLALALYFDQVGKALPRDGLVKPFWYSNLQFLKGEIPEEILQALPNPRTLIQGKKHVGDQFLFSSLFDEVGEQGVVFATFRSAFGAGALVATRRLDFMTPDRDRDLYHPGEFGRILSESAD